ncbi:site-specific DNA-methyltransferase [Candidatus Poribacteria bacterium]|nr:site-specific DNA-methyltransferase [Candidatus Poribacteria bacterium]
MTVPKREKSLAKSVATSLDVATHAVREYHTTALGAVYLGDSLNLLEQYVKPGSVDLIVTSPPFGLLRKKEYGNVDAEKYVEWFKPFGAAFRRVLKSKGSLVIDIGGAWNPGTPTRSLYHYELLIMLCRELGFHLAQEFFWWSPSKLPTPAEWTTVRRIRVKDAVDCVWWLSPTPWPRASNRRILSPYSESMKDLLKNGYRAKLRPSGHDISEKFSVDNGAAIPPNLIAIPNTESNSYYLRYCRDNNLEPHPARFPSELPELFIRMLTDPDDMVLDPFAGSCVTGEVAERLGRKWMCAELTEDYLKGALARFHHDAQSNCQEELFPLSGKAKKPPVTSYYKIFHPGALWKDLPFEPLPQDGGESRPATPKETMISKQL